MTQQLAFLDGQLVDPTKAVVPFTDAGFVQGTTVAEQLRTFGGQLFQLDAHLQRLQAALQTVGVTLPIDIDRLRQAAQELGQHNHRLLDPNDDLGLVIFVTPGDYPTFAAGPSRPRVGMHTYPLPFALWADRYRSGQALVVTPTRQTSEENWPLQLKCRSRMHYYLADQAARKIDPRARALLLHQDGTVGETSTANIVSIRSGRYLSPRGERTLPGISLGFLRQLVKEPWEERDFSVEQLLRSEEAILSSTPWCLMPVASIDGHALCDGKPSTGRFAALIDAWSSQVGLDIVQQAHRFASRKGVGDLFLGGETA